MAVDLGSASVGLHTGFNGGDGASAIDGLYLNCREQVMRKSKLGLKAVLVVWCIYFVGFGALVTATAVTGGGFVERVLATITIS